MNLAFRAISCLIESHWWLLLANIKRSCYAKKYKMGSHFHEYAKKKSKRPSEKLYKPRWIVKLSSNLAAGALSSSFSLSRLLDNARTLWLEKKKNIVWISCNENINQTQTNLTVLATHYKHLSLISHANLPQRQQYKS